MRPRTRVIAFAVSMILLALVLFPIIWTIVTSFKLKGEIGRYPPTFIFSPTLSNYAHIAERTEIFPAIIRSLIVTLSSTAVGLFVGTPAAYVFSRYAFRRKNDLKSWILSMRMLPPVAVVIPFYTIWLGLGLYDSFLSLIVTYSLITLPFTIWIMNSYFDGIPLDVEDAARVDGCNQFQAFTKIVLPLSINGLLITAVFIFISVWNEFFIAFILTTRNLTLPVAVAAHTKYGTTVPWGQIAAVTTILVAPALAFAVIVRKTIGALVRIR